MSDDKDPITPADFRDFFPTARPARLQQVINERDARIRLLEQQVQEAREILAGTAIGSLPNDYPLNKLALEVWNTLQERTLEGLALVEKNRLLEQQLKTAREEERERCAKLCDERVEKHDRHHIDGGSTFDAARADEAERIAASIRSLGEKE